MGRWSAVGRDDRARLVDDDTEALRAADVDAEVQR
jgi:hypothetical protein